MNFQTFSNYLEYSPLLALAGAFFFGVLTSLGPCTFLRAATLFGLVGERKEKTRGLLVAVFFVFGLWFAYSLMGIFASLLSKFADTSKAVYVFAGALLVVLGLNTSGLFKLPFPKGPNFLYKLRERFSQATGFLSVFTLGASFAFMICPCCLPALLTIFAFTFALGKFFYGIVLIFTFTIAHSIPLLLMSYFGHLAQKLAQARKVDVYLNLAIGVIIFVTGLIILWIS